MLVPISVADQDPGSSAILTPGSGSGSVFGMNNPDHISDSLETIFWVKILIFFDADKGSGMEKIQIRDKHPGSIRNTRTVPITAKENVKRNQDFSLFMRKNLSKTSKRCLTWSNPHRQPYIW
jgi:hypothetical protein